MARRNETTPKYVGRVLKARSLLSARQWASISFSLGLSDREFDVVQGVFDGCNEGSIAQKLGISAHTVHTHLDRLYRKLGVTTRSELILRVFAEFVNMGGRRRVGAPPPRVTRPKRPARVSRKRMARKT